MRMTRSLASKTLAAPSAFALLVGLVLTGCANLERHAVPVEASQNDDDAYCKQSAGPQGSNPYVACRKDRDVQRGRADNRLESQHRNLAERMLNGQ